MLGPPHGVQPRPSLPRRLRQLGASVLEYVLLVALVAVGFVTILTQHGESHGRLVNDG